jgi:hypothetical protein
VRARYSSGAAGGRKTRSHDFPKILTPDDPGGPPVPVTADERSRCVALLRAALADKAPFFQARLRRGGEGTP